VAWHDPDTGRPHARNYDAVINCTGPSPRPDSSNPFLHAMIGRGLARVAPLGIGLDVDDQCRVIADDGAAQPNLFALGALSFSTFGYALAVPFIAHQIVEALPALLKASERTGSETLAGEKLGEDVAPRGER
jgi:uncharacterized NAD(P)/FAD-binding protein YdhS